MRVLKCLAQGVFMSAHGVVIHQISNFPRWPMPRSPDGDKNRVRKKCPTVPVWQGGVGGGRGGVGEKLFGQCPYGGNAFQKGASLSVGSSGMTLFSFQLGQKVGKIYLWSQHLWDVVLQNPPSCEKAFKNLKDDTFQIWSDHLPFSKKNDNEWRFAGMLWRLTDCNISGLHKSINVLCLHLIGLIFSVYAVLSS